MIISTLCLLHLKISPKMWPKPSAKSFGLKTLATKAEAEGQKTSASAEDLQPSLDSWSRYPCIFQKKENSIPTFYNVFDEPDHFSQSAAFSAK